MQPTDDEQTKADTDGAEIPSYARGSILAGFAYVLIGHVVSCAIVSAFSWVGQGELSVLWYVAIGLAQLTYVIPIAYSLKKKGKPRTAQGVWIAAGITAFLNAACFGIAIASFRGL